MREEGRPLCRRAAEVLPTLVLLSFFAIDFFSLVWRPSMIFLNRFGITEARFTFLALRCLPSSRSISAFRLREMPFCAWILKRAATSVSCSIF